MASDQNFHLSSCSAADLELLSLDRLALPKDFVLPGLSIVYLPNFSGSIRVGEGQVLKSRASSSCFIVPDGTSLVIETVAVPSDLYFLSFLRQTRISWGRGMAPQVVHDDDRQRFVAIIDELTRVKSVVELESLVVEFLEEIKNSLMRSEPVPKPKRLYQNAVNIFEELRMASSFDFGISDVCHDLGIHISQASREFRRVYGMPPYRYWLLLRLARSRGALRETKGATSVGYDFGFADQSHFIRNFKRFMSVTPREYQMAAKRFSSGGQHG